MMNLVADKTLCVARAALAAVVLAYARMIAAALPDTVKALRLS